MRKTYKMLVLTSLFFIAFLTLFCSININNRTVYAEPSINETMSKEEIMEKYYELKEDNQKLRDEYDDLRGEWMSKEDDIDSRIDVIENCWKVASIIIVIFLGGSIFGIIKHINDKVKEKVEKEVSDKVPQEVAEKVGAEVKLIKKRIDDVKNEEWLKREKKILVISKNDEDKEKIQVVMRNFEGAEYEILENVNSLDKYDAIVFNNEYDKITNEEIVEIINNSCLDNEKVYLYFGNKLEQHSTQNINYANSKITLYNNLMSLLRFQDNVLLKNKKSTCE